MKKLIYCALALAAGLFAASCQQENLEPVAQENTVTYTVEVPGVATKAYGEGKKVNQLIYEVWKTDETGQINKNAVRLYQVNDKPLYLDEQGVRRAYITLNLVKDQTYRILLWAQVKEANGFVYYTTENLTEVSYKHNLESSYSANQEKYDAFYATKVISTFTAPKPEKISLKRPFAQLNIATENNVTDYTVTMNTSKVVVEGVPTVFDVATSEASDPTTVTFNTFNVPEGTVTVTTDAQSKSYDYAAMNYVFASKSGINAKVSYDINSTLTSKNLDGSNGVTTEAKVSNIIPNVPLKENYRTNIVGNLLSSSTKYEIVVDAEFKTDGNGDMFDINDGLIMNINGDYEISTAAGFAYAINNLFAEGGTFYIHPGRYDFTGIDVVPQPTEEGAILNVKANEVPVVTRSTTGFEIIGLNVAYLVSEVTDGSQAIFSNLVLPEDTKLVGTNNGVVGISGCSNEETNEAADLIGDNKGEIVNTVSMASVKEINDAIAQGLKLIELTGDITDGDNTVLTEIFTISSPVTINGCGHKLTSTAGRAINVSGANGVTIKNLVIDCSGERAINIIQNATNVTIDNVTATAANYTVNVAASAPDAVVNIKNSTLNGLCTVNVASPGAEVTVDNSTINCNDTNTTEGEAYAAIGLNKDAVRGHIIVTNSTINVTEGSDSMKARNGAEDGSITIDGSEGEVLVDVAAITFEGSDYYYAYASIDLAIDDAQKHNRPVTLIRNLTVAETVTIEEGQTVVLDLNGKTIAGTMHKSVGAVVENNGTLTIQNGTISSTADNGGSAVMNKGTLTVEDATLNGAPNADGSWPSYTVNNTAVMTANNTKFTSYHGSVSSYGEGAVVTLNDSEIDMAGIPGFTSHGIYTYNAGKVVVNGGTYANKATDQGASGASVINGAVEVNAGTFSGRIENYYGTPVLKGGTYSVKPNKNFLAKGYKAVEKGGIYTVIPDNYTLVSTADELVAALEAKESVVFANDITVAATKGGYNKAGILQNKAQTIDGNGHTLTVTGAGATWDCAIYTNGGLIKNLTVAGAMRGIFTAGQSSDLHIENVVFQNVIYTFNSDGDMPANPFGVYVSNSTVNGWTSHSNMHTEVVYNNCSFGEGSGYKYCRPYGKTSFVECTFCSGYTVDESITDDITYTNCVFN